ENGPCDRSASFCRSIPPTLHQMQKCSWIGIQFLQWSPFNSRNNAGGQPARLTQLDYDHQRADLFKGNQRTAQVINLDHGAPLSAFAQRQRCQTFVAVPIVSIPVTITGASRRGTVYASSRFRVGRVRREKGPIWSSALSRGGGGILRCT